jgi:hypothetical protein
MSETVQVTLQQLRKALVTLLGKSAQVTARDFCEVLPKKHTPIAWNAWQAAAEAEGLQIEKEKPWGITIWRKGAAKQIVPAIGALKQRGTKNGADNGSSLAGNGSQPHGVVPGMLGKGAVSVTEQGAGRTACVATQESRVRGSAPLPLSDVQRLAPGAHKEHPLTVAHAANDLTAGDSPEAIARKAQDLQQREHQAGRPCTAAEAVQRVTAQSNDSVKEAARRIADFQASEAAAGRQCTASEAAKRLGIG